MMEKLRNFMYGRYGNDMLNFGLLIAGCIITGVILTLGALLYARNCEKLNGENNLNNEESDQ